MRNLLEIQIGKIWVEGEISNLRKQASGHWYFSLKDEEAQISCVMFGARRREGSGFLENGNRVRVEAEASVFEARGQLQIVILRAEASGEGDLQQRFEALKKKLHAEGLFDADRKLPVPAFPKTIGLVTSASGAALQDILNVLTRRAPWVQPVLLPVRVQGKGAEWEIARAIRELGNPDAYGHPRCDVLIVGRGGGSLEDLWNFNEECVARAIADSMIPVISAVGHEIDFTIADFAADLRAPTPSAAAELAVADAGGLFQHLGQLRRRLTIPVRENLHRATTELRALRNGISLQAIRGRLRELSIRTDLSREAMKSAFIHRIQNRAADLDQLRVTHRFHHPEKLLERRAESVGMMRRRLEPALATPLRHWQERISGIAHTLRALGPESAFQRGFSITSDASGRIIRSPSDVKPGTMIHSRLAGGSIASTVTGSESNGSDPGAV